jgi:hypothetical protein
MGIVRMSFSQLYVIFVNIKLLQDGAGSPYSQKQILLKSLS